MFLLHSEEVGPQNLLKVLEVFVWVFGLTQKNNKGAIDSNSSHEGFLHFNISPERCFSGASGGSASFLERKKKKHGRKRRRTHPLQFGDVLLHRQAVQSSADGKERSQEARSEAQLEGRENS